jgi:hypothetical protein
VGHPGSCERAWSACSRSGGVGLAGARRRLLPDAELPEHHVEHVVGV